MRNHAIVLACAAGIITSTGCSQRTGTSSRTAGPVRVAATTPGLIPPGTPIEVRTNETIEADETAAGYTYSAMVTRAIVGADGNVLVPQGSPAQLVVQGVEQGGAVTGDKVQLGLRSITVNGRAYLVETDTTTTGDQGLGANRRTAKWVGGGAALGTLVGAIAGGGAGAAIGAAVGAAGGAAGQVLTKGDTVRVPAETVLTYRLDEPVRLQGFPAG